MFRSLSRNAQNSCGSVFFGHFRRTNFKFSSIRTLAKIVIHPVLASKELAALANTISRFPVGFTPEN